MSLIVLILIITAFKNCHGFFGSTVFENVHVEPDIIDVELGNPKTTLLNVVEEKWIEQNLDHFNRQNKQTWRMRYFENLEFFQTSGPIFIYVGGEWEITKARLLSGHMFDMAKDFNASMFYTEHRYYGKSRPTKNTSTENLKYLSVDQALADIAHFINSIKATIPGLQESKVFLIGGSYAGSIATWIRQKYPHLVDAVWASSAPLEAKLDFSEFNEVLSESIEIVGGEKCLAIFQSAFEKMEKIVESGNYTKLERNFKLCQPLETPDDIPHFFYEITDHIAAFVQGYTPGRIQSACRFLLNPAFPDSVVALGLWVNGLSKECLDMNYRKSVEKYSDVSWDSEGNKQLRQWIYQSCSKFGWFETTTSPNQIFGTKVPISYFIKLCSDLFDGKFNEENMKGYIKSTNQMYGGKQPEVTNVFFTNGYLDPWRPVSIQKDLNKNAPSVVIPLASHVSDLESISSTNTVELISVKKRIRELLIKWLK